MGFLNPNRLRVAAAFLAASLPACSIKKVAINALGNALAEGGSTYARDDDPELISQAVPFGLKTVEALLMESPRHKGLLFAAASGFTQYGYAFVQQEADFVEERDLARATELRTRARKLYLRGLEYGFRGLETDLPGLRDALRRDPSAALAKARKEHVPLLYWTALSWAAAMAITKEDPELTADQGSVEAMMKRALALDEGYGYGSIHDFFITYEGGRSSVGGSRTEARHHFEKAIGFAGGHRVAPLVAFAETVSVAAQDRPEFEKLLRQALDVDPGAVTDLRLTNLVYQRRARWLLGRADELFIE